LDAKFGVLQAADNVDTARIQLAQALGMDTYKDLDISGGIPAVDPPITADFESIAITTPTYLQAVHNEEVADAAVTIARSGFFPTLGVTANSLRSGETFFPQGNQWSLTVQLSLPLFNGGRDFFGTKSAIQSRKAAELTFHDVAHQQVYALQQAQTGFLEAVEQLKVATAYLDASKVRARIARTNYNNGITSFQDWDLAETDLITRQKNFIQAQQTRVTAQASWEQAQGKGAIP
jgi:outer membrane protein TolC